MEKISIYQVEEPPSPIVVFGFILVSSLPKTGKSRLLAEVKV
jgi:hypothetical protein